MEISFLQNAGLESVPVSFLKTHFTITIFWHGFSKVLLFKTSENFLRGIAAIPLVQEVATLLNMNYLEYTVYRTNFKGNFN